MEHTEDLIKTEINNEVKTEKKITRSSKATNPLFLIVIPTLTFIMFLLISQVLISNLKSNKEIIVYEQAESDIKTEIPSHLSVIRNKSFNNWSAGVKGKLVKKTSNQIELVPIKEVFTSTGERQITEIQNVANTRINLIPGVTKFLTFTGEIPENPVPVETTVENVQIGSILEGSVNLEYSNNDLIIKGNVLSVRNL